ncbi:putative peptidyl-prolyl cis-trans isomerase Cbf2 [Campylobacterota bacterium]|nr:putative peptidyl-prolyl cis-trans isomerase Cbf2 [Campylobacterota bacterium]
MKVVLRSMAVIAFTAAALSAATLATVNGEAISSEFVDQILAQQNVTFAKLTDEQKQQLIEQLVAGKLLAQHAIKQGVEKKTQYQQLLAYAKETVAADVFVKDIVDGIKVSDAEARKFYDQNKAQLEQPEQVHARHILVKTEDEGKAIIKELNGKKSAEREAAFEAIAKEKSEDQGSGARGGDLGFFTKDKMVKEFSDAAFALKKGELSKTPVKSAFGYHIIYVVEKKAAGAVPFDTVKEQLKNSVKRDKFNVEFEKLITDLKSQAKIEYSK